MEQRTAIRVYAKLNLFLRVVKKRDDGYHEIDTLMHPVQISDEIEVRPSRNGFSVECDHPEFPAGMDNTVAKSYLLLKQRHPDQVTSCHIRIKKSIPTQAGMGGASADAAGTLLALNRFFDLALPDAELGDLGAKIGSDVAFFFAKGPAVCRGRGEIIRPITGALEAPVALAVSHNGVSTKEAYARFSPIPAEDGKTSASMEEAIHSGDLGTVAQCLHNTFERLVYPVRPDLEQARLAFLSCGATGALMTGSGATVFALGMDEEKLECARKQITGRETLITALQQDTYEWL